MEFDSPDVMKDFPGLYASEHSKKGNNDSDYSDEADKALKKEPLIGKKKDKKDKDKGYAALEGESSGDDNCKSRSPSKAKKSKPLKFTTKSKEKREKSREKEKESEKKKDKDKKSEKKLEKNKKVKQSVDEAVDISEALPIFGVGLDTAVERSRCHDGVDIPLPVRQCIDYLQVAGITFESIYKISGPKSKVLQIRKMYNNRQSVDLNDYDVPTSTSLLKMFLRDLPEPLFTSESLIRFEEAGAILSTNTREKHLKILVDALPPLNKLLLSWLITHLTDISANERQNKMSKSNLAAALNHTFHCSSRLLNALLLHGNVLFPDLVLTKYIPPLGSGQRLPKDLESMQTELIKQESLLTQIHSEMNVGCISKEREEFLWEVQRIITQLKRNIKTEQKKVETVEKVEEELVQKVCEAQEVVEEEVTVEESLPVTIETVAEINNPPETVADMQETVEPQDEKVDIEVDTEKPEDLETMTLLKLKNIALLKLKEKLEKDIEKEKLEITELKKQVLESNNKHTCFVPNTECVDEVMSLLQKENQILEIKKINLVRQIMEQQEICIDLKAKLDLNTQNNNNKILAPCEG